MIALPSALAGSKPAALRAAEAHLSARNLQTGQVELVTTDASVRNPQEKRFKTWRWAGEDCIFIDTGNEDGTFGEPRHGGRPEREPPHHFLIKDGTLWLHEENDTIARIFSDAAQINVRDFRKVGLNPISDREDFDSWLKSSGFSSVEYVERKENGLAVVEARFGNLQVTWWIDPAKDHSLVRTEVREGDRTYGGQVFDLELIDGIWFPKMMKWVNAETGKAVRSVEMLRVELNRPEHPQSFEPSDIGIEVGMQISRVGPDAAGQPFMVWDGQRPILFQEYREKVAAGLLTPGPTLALAQRRAEVLREKQQAQVSVAQTPQAPKLDQERHISDWERYTRNFIRDMQLDAAQAERAMNILRDCQGQANQYLSTHSATIAELEKNLREEKTTEKARDELQKVFKSDQRHF